MVPNQNTRNIYHKQMNNDVLTPVWVDDEERDEDGVGHGRRPDEGHDERRNLRSGHHLQQGKKISKIIKGGCTAGTKVSAYGALWNMGLEIQVEQAEMFEIWSHPLGFDGTRVPGVPRVTLCSWNTRSPNCK